MIWRGCVFWGRRCGMRWVLMVLAMMGCGVDVECVDKAHRQQDVCSDACHEEHEACGSGCGTGECLDVCGEIAEECVSGCFRSADRALDACYP